MLRPARSSCCGCCRALQPSASPGLNGAVSQKDKIAAMAEKRKERLEASKAARTRSWPAETHVWVGCSAKECRPLIRSVAQRGRRGQTLGTIRRHRYCGQWRRSDRLGRATGRRRGPGGPFEELQRARAASAPRSGPCHRMITRARGVPCICGRGCATTEIAALCTGVPADRRPAFWLAAAQCADPIPCGPAGFAAALGECPTVHASNVDFPPT